MLSPGQRRCLVTIVVIAAGVRLFWALYATRGTPVSALVSGDEYSYWFHGRELAAGRGYVSYISGEPTAYYPIGYPGMLGGLFWVVTHTPIPDNLPMVTSIVQAILGTVSVALVFVIGRALFDARIGLIGAAVTALFPNLVFYTASFMLETTFIFLALAAVAVLVTHDWSTGMPTRARLIVFGTVLGASALVRPFSLLFLAGMVVAIVIRSGWRRAFVGLGWTILPVLVLLTPWTVRNIVVMDAPIVFSTGMGDALCTDRSLDATGRFRFVDHDGCVSTDKSEVERYQGNTRKAVEFVLRHPDRELAQIVKRAWYMGKEDHDGVMGVENTTGGKFLGHRVRTTLIRIADWYYYAVLALAVVGVAAFFRRRRPDRLFAGIALASLVAVPLGLWGNPRYHVPVLPFLALAAACGLMWLRGRAQAHSRGRNGPSSRYTTLSPDRSTSVAPGSVSNHSSGGRSATTTPNRSSST